MKRLFRLFLRAFGQDWRCRACGSGEVFVSQDGGHDWCERCVDCGARYGVQGPPFNIVQRLKDSKDCVEAIYQAKRTQVDDSRIQRLEDRVSSLEQRMNKSSTCRLNRKEAAPDNL